MSIVKCKIISLTQQDKSNSLKRHFLTALTQMDISVVRDFKTCIPFEAETMADLEALKQKHPSGKFKLNGYIALLIKLGKSYKSQSETEIRKDPNNYIFEVPICDLAGIRAEDLAAYLGTESNWETSQTPPQKLPDKWPDERYASDPNSVINSLNPERSGLIFTGTKDYSDSSGQWHLDSTSIFLKDGSVVVGMFGNDTYSITFSKKNTGTEYLMLPLLKFSPLFENEYTQEISHLIFGKIIPHILNNTANTHWVTEHMQKTECEYVYLNLINYFFHRTPQIDDPERIHIVV